METILLISILGLILQGIIIAVMPFICMKVFQRLVMPGLEEARKAGMEMLQQAETEPEEDEVEHYKFMQSISPLARMYTGWTPESEEEKSGPEGVPHDQDPTIKELYADIAAAVSQGQGQERSGKQP